MLSEQLNVRFMKFIPFIVLTSLIFMGWYFLCSVKILPSYLLPSPYQVLYSLSNNINFLLTSLGYTIKITMISFVLSSLIGVFIATLLVQGKWIESAITPYVVMLQVTPFVAIAPLLQIWANNVSTAVIILAIIASVLPIMNNTLLGLKSVDKDLLNLFSIYHASRLKRLYYLQFPSALPNTIAGLKIGISLSLIGTVVGQFLLSNSKSNGGIAYILMQSEYNLKTSLLFAALFLLIISGALLYVLADKIGSILTSRWHESEI